MLLILLLPAKPKESDYAAIEGICASEWKNSLTFALAVV